MIAGRAWIFGDNVNTDLMAPARLLKRPVAEYASHCLETLQPKFASEVKRGDIVVGGVNFGCGSSREHAPQALYRRGIRAVIGESFAEIFASNSLMIGLTCVSMTAEPILGLMMAVDWDPAVEVVVNIESGAVKAAGQSWPIDLPPHARHALITGQWDGAGLLLENYGDVEAVDASLPYSF